MVRRRNRTTRGILTDRHPARFQPNQRSEASTNPGTSTCRTLEPVEPRTDEGSFRKPSLRHEPSSSPYAKARAIHLHRDRVPAAVVFAGRRVAERVLLAQFVGDAGGRWIEVAWRANDL